MNEYKDSNMVLSNEIESLRIVVKKVRLLPISPKLSQTINFNWKLPKNLRLIL